MLPILIWSQSGHACHSHLVTIRTCMIASHSHLVTIRTCLPFSSGHNQDMHDCFPFSSGHNQDMLPILIWSQSGHASHSHLVTIRTCMIASHSHLVTIRTCLPFSAGQVCRHPVFYTDRTCLPFSAGQVCRHPVFYTETGHACHSQLGKSAGILCFTQRQDMLAILSWASLQASCVLHRDRTCLPFSAGQVCRHPVFYTETGHASHSQLGKFAGIL